MITFVLLAKFSSFTSGVELWLDSNVTGVVVLVLMRSSEKPLVMPIAEMPASAEVASVGVSSRQSVAPGTYPNGALINQARAQVTQMTAQYRNLMRSIFNINVASATLPVTQQLEQVIRNGQTSDFAILKTNYGNTYGPVPAATAAGAPDRAMTDMDDALAMDVLSALKAKRRGGHPDLADGGSNGERRGPGSPGLGALSYRQCGSGQHPVPSPDPETARCRTAAGSSASRARERSA